MKALFFILLPLGLLSVLILLVGNNTPLATTSYMPAASSTNDASTSSSTLEIVTAALGERSYPDQKKKPSDCKEDDQACLLASYADYKRAMISEFGFWRRFENVARSGSAINAALALRSARENKQYRHIGWSVSNDLPFRTKEAAESCRIAIINMKYLLIGISSGKIDDGAAEVKEFLTSGAECRKTARAK